jgi:hypothetical protein
MVDDQNKNKPSQPNDNDSPFNFLNQLSESAPIEEEPGFSFPSFDQAATPPTAAAQPPATPAPKKVPAPKPKPTQQVKPVEETQVPELDELSDELDRLSSDLPDFLKEMSNSGGAEADEVESFTPGFQLPGLPLPDASIAKTPAATPPASSPKAKASTPPPPAETKAEATENKPRFFSQTSKPQVPQAEPPVGMPPVMSPPPADNPFQFPGFEVPTEEAPADDAAGFFPDFTLVMNKPDEIVSASKSASKKPESPAIDPALMAKAKQMIQPPAAEAKSPPKAKPPVAAKPISPPASAVPPAPPAAETTVFPGFPSFDADPVEEAPGAGFGFPDFAATTSEPEATGFHIMDATPAPQAPVTPAKAVVSSPKPVAKEKPPAPAVKSVAAEKVVAEKAVQKPAAKTSAKATKKQDDEEPAKNTGVPFIVFIVMLVYSSLITLYCVHLYIEGWTGNPKELESLPDIKPEIKEGEVVYKLVPEGRKVPAGHTLELGQSRRFGNILVSPKKVTYGAVKFDHYSGDAKKTYPASDPALKLWVEFKNVSENQIFAPIDRELLLTRVPDRSNPKWLRSNQFLAQSKERSSPGKQLLMYDLPVSSDWNFHDVPEALVLKPGESKSVYLPSVPVELDQQTGRMVWRMQIRKGYDPKTRHGVTTLVEVVFNANSVTRDET